MVSKEIARKIRRIQYRRTDFASEQDDDSIIGNADNVRHRIRRWERAITPSLPLSKEYKKGDEVSFTQDQIRNWVVVDSLGNEEGNYVGKAIEAFDSGIVGVFFEGVFKKGKFEFKYQDAKSAKYQNSIDGIVSQETIAEIAKRLKASYEKKRREGQKFEEGKPFFTYGIYDFRTGEVKP